MASHFWLNGPPKCHFCERLATYIRVKDRLPACDDHRYTEKDID